MNLSPAIFGVMAILCLLCDQCQAAPEVASNAHRRFRSQPLFHGRYPVDEVIIEDEDMMELNKRQQFDDYGHMRFGKRSDQFDDYGHMRFGRSHE